MKKVFSIVLFGLIVLSLAFNAWLYFNQQQLKIKTDFSYKQLLLEEGSDSDQNSKNIQTNYDYSNQALEKNIDGITQDLEALQTKVASLEASIDKIEVVTKTTPVVTQSSKVKEHYVYLGTGSTTSRDWQDIDSTITVIDTANYGKIKSVTFEAALSILGGEVHARLANKGTGAIFYDSHVFHNTSTSNWKSSSAISLHHGSNRYVVQLKSTSGEKASLDGARLKIIVE